LTANQTNTNEAAQGIIKVQQVEANPETITAIISFEGEAEQSKRFSGILFFDETNLKLTDIKFDQTVFEPLSGYNINKNKLKILCYLQPKSGPLVTINFARLTNCPQITFELFPLGQNFFTFDEKISVQYEKKLVEVIPEFKLYQNYPNPVINSKTKIGYEIPKTSNVVIKIFNILGAEVKTAVRSRESEGKHEILFDASELPSGIYTYRLETDGGLSDKKKMIILK